MNFIKTLFALTLVLAVSFNNAVASDGDGSPIGISMDAFPNPVAPGTPLILEISGVDITSAGVTLLNMRGRSVEMTLEFRLNRAKIKTDRLSSGQVYTIVLELPTGEVFTQQITAR